MATKNFLQLSFQAEIKLDTVLSMVILMFLQHQKFWSLDDNRITFGNPIKFEKLDIETLNPSIKTWEVFDLKILRSVFGYWAIPNDFITLKLFAPPNINSEGGSDFTSPDNLKCKNAENFSTKALVVK